MKSIDVKKDLRVIVTHRSSKHKGRIGKITSVNLKTFRKGVDFVMVKFDDDGKSAPFGVCSIQPYSGCTVATPRSENQEPISYKIGDLIEVISPIEYSGRTVGDIYKVVAANGTTTKFEFVSGTKPSKGWESGSLLNKLMSKYWKPHIDTSEFPEKLVVGMKLRSKTSASVNRSVDDVVEVTKVLKDGCFYYNNLTTGKIDFLYGNVENLSHNFSVVSIPTEDSSTTSQEAVSKKMPCEPCVGMILVSKSNIEGSRSVGDNLRVTSVNAYGDFHYRNMKTDVLSFCVAEKYNTDNFEIMSK